MSLRLRILALVSLVAVTAIGATAYFAFRQAARQVTETAAADRQTINHIVDELVAYATSHGTWEGVAPLVGRLGAETGQRIKLMAEWDEVIVDTDTLAGRTARGVPSPPVLADPRPSLTLTAAQLAKPDTAVKETLTAIQRYRKDVRFAACLSRGSVTAQDVQQCRDGLGLNYPEAIDPTLAEACEAEGVQAAHLLDCLQKVFAVQTADVAPVPMRVYLGAVGDPGPSLEPGPVMAAAALVALLALAGTALISRRVLRPISVLTAASERLGEGDLHHRVPDTGRDELTALARSFNRMADSLQKGEERQRRLIADVAHELRTPLANLRGYLEALKDGVLPAGPELFASLHEEALLQQRLVDDLQDLALAEAGVLTYHRSRVDLAELLETCRNAHQAAAETAGVTLRVRADEPVAVHADPDRLRQVVGNLVSNALRATPAGGEVTLSAGRVHGSAVVVVHDTGVGVAAEDLPRLFDRLWRADAARGRATGGSGLGLAIARQIVNDHCGHMSVHSELDVGTAVTVTLPLETPATEHDIAPPVAHRS